MRDTFRKIWLIPLATLCLMATSSAEETIKERGIAPPAPASVETNAASEPSVTVLGSRQVHTILGRDVRSSANENMGRIVDVIVDQTGKVRAAVIDFGGFLGVGSRRIAVDWNALRFDLDSGKHDLITLELTRDQVKAAPEFKDKQAVIVLGAAGKLQSLPD